MINEKISNVSNIYVAYDNIENQSQELISDLREACNDTMSNHAWTQERNKSGLIVKCTKLLVMIGIVVLWEKFVDFVVDYFGTRVSILTALYRQDVAFFVKLLLLLLAVKVSYSIVRAYWCSKVISYHAKINKIEKEVLRKIDECKAKNILDTTLKAISNEQDRVFPKENKLGDDIRNMREEIYRLRVKIKQNKKKVDIFTAVILAGIMGLAMIFGLKPMNVIGFSPAYAMATIVMWLLVMEVIIIILMNLSEYLGKYTKILGIFLTIGYGFLFHIAVKNDKQCVLEYELIKGISDNAVQWFSVSRAIPVLFVVGTILIICCTNIASEVLKLRDGFVIKMFSGPDEIGRKTGVYFLGIWYVINALFLVNAVASDVHFGFFNYIIYGAFWWAVNPILRPMGSKLYYFWGIGRCIMNEVIMYIFCLLLTVGYRDTIGKEDMINYAIVVVISFVVGAVIKRMAEIE